MRFCSRLCSNTFHNPSVAKKDKCEICKVVFVHNLKRHRTRCDKHIKIHTETTKRKISKSMMNHNVTGAARHKMSQKARKRWSK